MTKHVFSLVIVVCINKNTPGTKNVSNITHLGITVFHKSPYFNGTTDTHLKLRLPQTRPKGNQRWILMPTCLSILPHRLLDYSLCDCQSKPFWLTAIQVFLIFSSFFLFHHNFPPFTDFFLYLHISCVLHKV